MEGDFLVDLAVGLRETPPRIKTKYLYDERGSQAFVRFLDKTPEYAPYHQELRLIAERREEILRSLGVIVHVLSLGCGTAEKEKALFFASKSEARAAVTLLDISPTMLDRAVENLTDLGGLLSLRAMRMDVENLLASRFSWERPVSVLTCLGNTVSNYDPATIVALLSALRELPVAPENVLVGSSHAASPTIGPYVASEFARVQWNAVERLARAFGVPISRELVETTIVYDEQARRYESRIVFKRSFRGALVGAEYAFDVEDYIVIGETYNYEPDFLGSLFERSGWRSAATWSSSDGAVRLTHLRTDS